MLIVKLLKILYNNSGGKMRLKEKKELLLFLKENNIFLSDNTLSLIYNVYRLGSIDYEMLKNNDICDNEVYLNLIFSKKQINERTIMYRLCLNNDFKNDYELLNFLSNIEIDKIKDIVYLFKQKSMIIEYDLFNNYLEFLNNNNDKRVSFIAYCISSLSEIEREYLKKYFSKKTNTKNK